MKPVRPAAPSDSVSQPVNFSLVVESEGRLGQRHGLALTLGQAHLVPRSLFAPVPGAPIDFRAVRIIPLDMVEEAIVGDVSAHATPLGRAGVSRARVASWHAWSDRSHPLVALARSGEIKPPEQLSPGRPSWPTLGRIATLTLDGDLASTTHVFRSREVRSRAMRLMLSGESSAASDYPLLGSPVLTSSNVVVGMVVDLEAASDDSHSARIVVNSIRGLRFRDRTIIAR